jgi:hypothetical protein
VYPLSVFALECNQHFKVYRYQRARNNLAIDKSGSFLKLSIYRYLLFTINGMCVL